MSQTVSEIVADTLVEAGAKRVYGIVGDTINHFIDAVRRSPLDWVHVRHEEVGALAAGGESYMTGELSVCAGTAGPGSLHFVNGIFESHRNGAPVVLIASNVDRAEQGLGFPQEVDQRKIYEQTSVFCEAISHPDQARRITAMAAQAALARGGVAVVIVNGDMFKQTSDDARHWSVHRASPVVRPSEAELDALAAMIAEAKRPTIYVGIGARGAADQVKALAERLAAPVVHTTRSKEFIEPANNWNVGMTGILGNRAGMEAVADCDLLICLGTDFAYTQFYPERAKIAQVDTDPTHLGRRTPVDLGLVGDVGATIEALLPRLQPREADKHLTAAREQWAKDRAGYDKQADEPDPALIHPQHVAHLLDRLAGDDAIFTADGGSPMVWLLRHLTARGRRRFLTSLMHGTMANAYPQAMGIKLAYPDRPVIAMCGDGGMTMLMGDLLTLVQEEIPIKLLIFNNSSLGFVEMEQRVEGLLDSFTGLKNPDFAALARCVGIEGTRVEAAGDLDAAMRQWLAAKGPALLDVKVNRMELVMPPKIEAGQVAGTAMFGLRAVLGGRSGEVVDLLRDNFLR
ncbi:pyruvate dehydrogenase [Defluviimonas sp. 20V17]|uniref:Pyruvate dehydrogenase n=1 Tax=Allgaiera indica TaxID=765699 RepID=A0AAN4USE2_9RHOB|nr:thiamine pyrophosphate-dependent enzyme [Allgaiera indica]KDB02210.1 pyruvate dehydrogenase [Defluviimonas sp. 20V17]GHE02732.1 pyruvate dehydrogenase [Allgaiera indica]SDX18554.1 pyruvate dehydrogenase (quinone) [Allgaiera indica]